MIIGYTQTFPRYIGSLPDENDDDEKGPCCIDTMQLIQSWHLIANIKKVPFSNRSTISSTEMETHGGSQS